MRPTLTLALATYGETVRRPLYCILTLCFAVAVFLSKMLTMFSFHQEVNMVREMGMATIIFWAFIIVLLTPASVVTQELEDRTAVTLLSKPLLRRDFILGKYFGLALSLLPGMFVLAGALYLTLWSMTSDTLLFPDARLVETESPFTATLGAIWEQFVVRQGALVLAGTLLAWLQACVLGAVAVSLAAFFPVVVSVSAVTFLFVVGNVAGYMVASMHTVGSAPLSFAGDALVTLLPNLGYFNLQASFSEGRLISVRYLGLALVYSTLYVGAVFLVSCSLFRTREVR